MLKKGLVHGLELLDRAYLGSSLGLGLEPCGVRGVVFHTVLKNESERENTSILPHQAITISQYRSFFSRLLSKNYRFLASSDLDSVNPNNGLFIYVSFDDGYFNNLKILPLIEEFEIPIHIFVATEYSARNRKYWWDVVYAEGNARGLTDQEISGYISSLKLLKPHEIERKISDQFGEAAWTPTGSLDRPLTIKELSEISKHPLITIGNHTHRHAISTNLSAKMFQQEINDAQQVLLEAIGCYPESFAFPNGDWSPEYLSVCEESGFKFAFGCDERIAFGPKEVGGLEKFRIGRYSISPNRSMVWQADMIRSTHSLDRLIRRWWFGSREARTA